MYTARDVLGLDPVTMRFAAAREAVQKLGLLVPKAEAIIWHMLDDRFEGHHPTEISTAYRKDGEQISKEEKKALGVRSNAFLSRKAFDELAENGRSTPLIAHETVLLRATFTLIRYKSILNARQIESPVFNDEFKYDMLKLDCQACKELDGTVTKGDDAKIFPPDNCVCDTANYGLKPVIDFIAGVD
jgi:hypothetical protein